MHVPSHSDTERESAKWAIFARWYYTPIAFVFAMFAKDDLIFFDAATALSVAFLATIACNVCFHVIVRSMEADASPASMRALRVGQAALDLSFFFLIVLFTGGAASTLWALLLIPILLAMLFFDFWGITAVALTAGALVLLAGFGNAVDSTGDALGASGLKVHMTPDALMTSGISFLVFLFAGFFGGFFARRMRRRDLLLLGEIAKGQEQVRRLEKLTAEFDQSAKLLVRRDLELTSANEKLKQLDLMKSEIISIVAHQLRTPLSGTKWMLKMLIDGDKGKLSKEQYALLVKGFESNERMVALINDMLAVDHLESGKLRYEFIPVQFEPLVEELVKNLQPIAAHKKIAVEFRSPKDLLPQIKLDPEKIRDVLQNLIDNAVKYTKAGGLVTIGAEMEGGGLHFWVKDNGIGIPEDAKDRIFSRFFRGRNAISTETDGSGLGLFIAQSVVKRHGGKIWFESTEGQGSTFHVLLPTPP